MINRRLMRLCLVGFAGAFAAAGAQARSGAIRVIVGYPACAASDALTRVLAAHMTATLKQPVIVENETGAGGRIAMELAKAAAADGTTLVMAPVATISIFATSLAGLLLYDPLKDFAPVAHLANSSSG